MEHRLSSASLTELRRPRPYPAVSVLTPTHRRGPDSAQDPVRLRNVIAEAKKRLEDDPAVTRERRTDVVAQLEQALAEVDLSRAEDGLAIFAAPGEHQVWSLARTVPERVVLSDTFLTRNLVAARAAENPFWVLTVSADRIALWSGGAGHVVEARTAGFPLTRSLDSPDFERRERLGDVPSTFSDEHTRRFLRDGDTALAGVLRAVPRPVYVAGDQAALALLAEVGTATGDAVHVPHGGLGHAGADAVWQAVGPLVAAEDLRRIDSVTIELDHARSRREYAAGVDEVWQNATAGRVRLLAVEENHRVTVRDDGDHLVPADGDDLDARDDIVDEIVEQCLDTGAEVRFVPDGTLAEAEGIAGVLRY
ncbi:chemotaxis protein [Streptomyces beigongshangae]|uniref:baeRF3 domain-containing protein n=1 Tax=Streptomyces beigongshangae TaxID=2841597 RepID=UPI001C864149|nr:chemotaxis protein [Streptomyces sp. REN17]